MERWSRLALGPATGCGAVVIGMLVVAGWQFDLPALRTWGAPTRGSSPLTGLMLVGAGLAAALGTGRSRSRRSARLLIATLSGALAAVAAAEWLAAPDAGLHTRLWPAAVLAAGGRQPGLPSPVTSLSVLLLMAGLLAGAGRRPRGGVVAGVAGITVAVTGAVFMTGHLTGTPSLYADGLGSAVGYPTGAGLMLVGLSVLATAGDPDTISIGAGSVAARRLLLLLPAILAAQLAVAVTDYKVLAGGRPPELLVPVVVLTVSALACSAGWLAARAQHGWVTTRATATDRTGVGFLAACRGRVVAANLPLARLLGVPVEELRAGRLPEPLAGLVRRSPRRPAARRSRPPLEAPTSMELPRPDGGTASVVVSWSASRHDGRWMNIFMVEDRTARVRAERDLGEAGSKLALYAAMVDCAGDAMVATDRDGVILAWNPAAERLYGPAAEDVVGKPRETLSPAVPPEERAEALRALDRAHRGEDTIIAEATRFVAGGRRATVSLRLSPLRSPEGEIIGAASVTRDISASVASDRMLRLLVDRVPLGLLTVAPDGTIRQANPAASRIYGYPAEELIGSSVDRLTPEPFRDGGAERRAEQFRTARAGTHGATLRADGLRADGSVVPIEAALTLIDLADGPQLLTVVADISERVAAERILARRATALVQANEDLRQYAYLASHDLQEPVRMVANYAELLAQRYGESWDERGQQYLAYVLEGTTRMRQMILGLLELSLVERSATTPGAVDLGDVVEAAVAEQREVIEAAGAAVSVVGELPVVLGHPEQLTRVVSNLVSNAVKFRGERAPVVTVSARWSPEGWAVSVEDNGIGIAVEDARSVFGMFRRLHGREDFEGTGIGLALVERIVARHGGWVWVDSRPGAGARFSFVLPHTPPDRDGETEVAAGSPAEPGPPVPVPDPALGAEGGLASRSTA